MKLGYARHGLRVTVRLHGTVVSQRVLWAPPVEELLSLALVGGGVAFVMSLLARGNVEVLGVWSPLMSQLSVLLLVPSSVAAALAALAWPRRLELGEHGRDAVPGPDGGPLARVEWEPGKDPLLVDHTRGEQALQMGPGARWGWASDGVEVDVQAQELQRARRLPTDPLGDMSLVVVALCLYVGLIQARTFVENVPGQAKGADEMGYELNPELIARLLQRDFEGADHGVQPRVDRPELEREVDSYYLPAGNDGAMTRAGGGRVDGDEIRRVPEPEEPEELEELLARDEAGEDAIELQASTEEQDALAEATAPESPFDESLDPQDEQLAGRERDPMERFIGWGFRDWIDASARQKQLSPEVERQLMFARERLRIDPDDPDALQTVGHYAYLAEQIDLCRSAYERMIELYPDFAAAYNNLALTYKRQGDFETEEALYRKALELDPTDEIVLNNLAVTLAHQERYDEALSIMALLEEIDPEDPYSDLHRAKVYAAMGKTDRAYKYLKRALDGVEQLNTLHHIEFRQDLRLEPLFDEMRGQARFQRMIRTAYGPDADAVLAGGDRG